VPIYNFRFNHPNGGPGLFPPGLAFAGAFMPVEIHVPPQMADLLTRDGKPVPDGVSGVAIIDTGATFTSIDESILKGLGLASVGPIVSGTANGPAVHQMYPARIVFPTIPGFDVNAQQAVGVNLTGQAIPTAPKQPPQRIVALIGRNLLANWLFVWNGPAGQWSISF